MAPDLVPAGGMLLYRRSFGSARDAPDCAANNSELVYLEGKTLQRGWEILLMDIWGCL